MRALTSLALLALLAAPARAEAPSWSGEVERIVRQRCAGCHRQGEATPMPLSTYKEARPYAKAIRDELLTGRMPPWPADPRHGRFRDARHLPERERAALLAWVAAGAPEGRRSSVRPLPPLSGGWHIGPPHQVVSLPAPVPVPKEGDLDLQYFKLGVVFPEERWVEAMEVLPGDRRVVHHATVYLVPPRGAAEAPVGLSCARARDKNAALREQRIRNDGGDTARRRYLFSWTPGSTPFRAVAGAARHIPAGSALVFEMHYEPNGVATQDQTRLGLRFGRAPATTAIESEFSMQTQLDIPPGAADHEETACFEVVRDGVTLLALKPHMHLRGKDIRVELERPGAPPETLLAIPRWDFDWQVFYELETPLPLPRGARLRTIGHFDNSAANPRNPDPTREVVWDERTTGEMLATTYMFSAPR